MKTTGKVFLIIGALFIVVLAKGVGKSAGKSAFDDAVEKKLLETSQQINKQLPAMIDKDTRADTTMCSGMHLIYKYTMVNLSEKDVDKIAFKNTMKSMLVKNQCSNENMIKMLNMGVEYDYMYQDRFGNILATINVSKKDCGY